MNIHALIDSVDQDTIDDLDFDIEINPDNRAMIAECNISTLFDVLGALNSGLTIETIDGILTGSHVDWFTLEGDMQYL